MASSWQFFIHIYSKARKFIDSSNRSAIYRDMVITYFVFEIIWRSNKKIFWGVFWMNLKFVTSHPLHLICVYNNVEIMKRCTDYRIISVKEWVWVLQAFRYSKKNRGPRIEPCGTLNCLGVKYFVVYRIESFFKIEKYHTVYFSILHIFEKLITQSY